MFFWWQPSHQVPPLTTRIYGHYFSTEHKTACSNGQMFFKPSFWGPPWHITAASAPLKSPWLLYWLSSDYHRQTLPLHHSVSHPRKGEIREKTLTEELKHSHNINWTNDWDVAHYTKRKQHKTLGWSFFRPSFFFVSPYVNHILVLSNAYIFAINCFIFFSASQLLYLITRFKISSRFTCYTYHKYAFQADSQFWLF